MAQDAGETTTRSRFRKLLDWPHWTSAMWVSLLLCLGTCIGLAWYDSPSNTGVLRAGEIGTVGGASLRRSEVEGWTGYAPSLLEISRVRVGMRVAAENPEVSDAERKNFVDPDPETWRFLKLRLPKNQSTDSGSASSLVLTSTLATDFVAIDLLRPLEWLEQQQAKVGGRVYLDLEELGAKGWAEVLEIGPCPEIVPGPGSVVTATFAHQPTSEILDVTITGSDGSKETIGVTANHPFWSVDHHAFIPVGHLEPGIRVKTHLDQIQTIVSLHPRPGPSEQVYNLEVHGEHVYYVGTNSILVHNLYDSEILGRNLASGAANPRIYLDKIRAKGYQAAHIVPTSTWAKSNNISKLAKKAIADSHAKLKSVGIDINDLRNGFWAKPGHLGSHKEKFFVEMGKALRNTKTRRDVEDALMSLKRRLQAGEFR